MTGRSSNISAALALAIVAGCYAKPDIEITAVRSADYNIEITLCGTTCKEPKAVFPTNVPDMTRSVFIFVEEDLAQIRLSLDRDSPDFAGCVTVELGGDTLERTLTIGDTGVTTWMCDPDVPCETVEAGLCP
jgi:hypothetical protein